MLTYCNTHLSILVPHSLRILHHTAIHCNTLQHTATYCNTLQHTATHTWRFLYLTASAYCNTLQCNTMPHTATHYNFTHLAILVPHSLRILQHTTTHRNTLQHTATRSWRFSCLTASAYCNKLQHTATHCNTLQHTATHCNILQLAPGDSRA